MGARCPDSYRNTCTFCNDIGHRSPAYIHVKKHVMRGDFTVNSNVDCKKHFVHYPPVLKNIKFGLYSYITVSCNAISYLL